MVPDLLGNLAQCAFLIGNTTSATTYSPTPAIYFRRFGGV